MQYTPQVRVGGGMHQFGHQNNDWRGNGFVANPVGFVPNSGVGSTSASPRISAIPQQQQQHKPVNRAPQQIQQVILMEIVYNLD